MARKKHDGDPGFLSIIVPFPCISETTEKGMDLLERVQLPIYAGLSAGSVDELPRGVQPIYLRESEPQFWRLTDCSSIQSEWCLFLEEDEFLEKEAMSELPEVLSNLASIPHMVTVTRFLPEDQIKQFDWVTSRDVFSSPTANMVAYHLMELRLIPSDQLDRVILEKTAWRKPASTFSLRLFSGDVKMAKPGFAQLSVCRVKPHSDGDAWEKPEDREIFIKGHGRFFDDVRFVEGFEWPRTAYILILPDHVRAIFEGLRQGISSRPIVMRTLYNLMQLGEYEWAAQLLPLMPEHWEFENPVLIQIKAMAYFFAGDVEDVRRALERGCVQNPGNPTVLENTGKFFLLLKERERAQHYFQKSLDHLEKEEEKAHVRAFLQVLEDNGECWPTLSVCVIVRDEEKLLPQALKSVASLADEIIVVDTGSHDRSREIAEKSGARVFNYSWEDDFSKVRNFAMEKAASDYVFMLDADEHFSSLKLVEFHVLKRLLPLKRPRAFSLAVGHFRVETDWISVLMGSDNFVTETRAIRIFPNLDNLQYRGRFGESLVDALTRLNIPVSDLPEKQIWLQHDVRGRGQRLLRKMSAYEKETDPNLGQIATAIRDLSYLGDRAGTIRWLKRLINIETEEAVPFIPGMGIRLARLVEGDSPEKAQEIIGYLRKMSPEDKKLKLTLSSYFIRNGLFSKLSDLDFSDIVETSGSGVSDENMEYWIHGGVAVVERGDINTAAWIIDQALSRSPDNLLGQCARFFLLSRIGDLESSALALEDILDITSGCTSTQVMTPLEFLKTVEELSDTLGKWGHAVERSLLLHGALALNGQLEATK